MSYWVKDWDESRARRGRKQAARYRTDCKIGRHVIAEGQDAVWLTDPMGLSCRACADRVGQGRAA